MKTMSEQITHFVDPELGKLRGIDGVPLKSGNTGTTFDLSKVNCVNCNNILNLTEFQDKEEDTEYFSSDSNIAQALNLDRTIKKAVITATKSINAVIDASRIIENNPGIFEDYAPIRSFLLDHNLIQKKVKNAWVQPQQKRKETKLYSMGKELKTKFKNGRGRKAVYVLNLTINNHQLNRVIHKSFKLTGSQKVKNLRLHEGNLYNNGKLLLKVTGSTIERFGFYRIGSMVKGKFVKE